jgi:predicted transposase/invertase (TIGR01784 family)
MKFADPKNDIAFKKVFGDENHKNILISFLNSVLDFTGGKEIVDVSLANPYQVPKIPDLKETILDIKAVNKNGDTFIVEMQKKDLGDFTKRSLYYTAKAYVAQLPKGKDYTALNKVYFIGLLNFTIFDNESYISRHLIINQETNTQDLDDFEFSFIELPKFTKSLAELSTTLDKWIFFLKNASDLAFVPEEYQKIEAFKNAFDIVTQTAWEPKELEVYDYIALREFDEINALRTAERKGLKKGMEKGIEKEKRIIALSLLDVLDVETIALKTGLSEAEVIALKS